jgi:hypothetical protein
MTPWPGCVLVWTEVPDEFDRGFNDWYNREHMSSRVLAVPGYRWGRRFVSTGSGPRYLALYRTDSIDVFRSEAYLKLQAEPDPDSRRFIPQFRNTVKGFCSVSAEHGVGQGGRLALVRLDLSACDRPKLRAWMSETLLPRLVAQPDVTAACLAECDADIVRAATAKFIRKGDTWVDGVVFIEATSEAGLRNALALLDGAVEPHGAIRQGEPGEFSQTLSYHVQ